MSRKKARILPMVGVQAVPGTVLSLLPIPGQTWQQQKNPIGATPPEDWWQGIAGTDPETEVNAGRARDVSGKILIPDQLADHVDRLGRALWAGFEHEWRLAVRDAERRRDPDGRTMDPERRSTRTPPTRTGP